MNSRPQSANQDEDADPEVEPAIRWIIRNDLI